MDNLINSNKDIFFNKDIFVNIFNENGNVYFYAPGHNEMIKINQKKLYEFLKKFEDKKIKEDF